MPSLFDPLTIGSVTLKNRIVLAPLTRMRATDEGVPTDIMQEYYCQRASCGLEITEGTQISPTAQGYGRTPGFYSSDQLARWEKIVQAVHEAGGLIAPQLWHTGRVSHENILPDRLAPLSPTHEWSSCRTTLIDPDGTPQRVRVGKPRAATLEDISSLIADYAAAAASAHYIGCDLIEVHAAHGYLLHQFQSLEVNTREDEYGGSARNRARLTLEALDAAIGAWDRTKVGIRISPWGSFNDVATGDEEVVWYLIKEIADREIAYLHLSEPDWVGGEKISLDIRQQLRKSYPGTIIAAGGYTREKADSLIEQGLIDAAAFGRTFIANPDLPERLRTGATLNEQRKELFYGYGSEGYIDYPTI